MRPIGIFDSGVGGLGIFKAIAQQIPGQDLIYLADNNNLPFGQKTTAQLQQITSKILDYLIKIHNIKMAVVACNTASVSSLAYLREKYPIPIVGVVPVVKPACELSKAKKVAILATLHTTNSEYQKQLIAQYGKGVDGTGAGSQGPIEVLSIACPDLVELIEAGLFDDPRMQEKLREYLAPALDIGVDVVGLSCTHYPFLRAQIQQLLPPGVAIVDANDAVSRQVVKVNSKISDIPDASPMGDGSTSSQPSLFVSFGGQAPRARPDELARLPEKPAKYSFYVTKDSEKFAMVAQKLLGEIPGDVTLISL